jgi:hypothetical protein
MRCPPWLLRRPWSGLRAPLALLCAAWLAACGGKAGEGTAPPKGAQQPPTLRFEGLVYVDAGTSDFKILERVRQETLTIFPGLRKSKVMVSRREVPGASVESFKREPVTVVGPGDERRPAVRVRFRYAARPDVAPDLDGGLEIPLAVLHRSRGADPQRVLRECSNASPDDRQAGSSLNLVFDPTLDRCKEAIRAEQAAIDAARQRLGGGDPGDTIPVEELDRVYLPIRVTLEASAPQPDKAPAREGGSFPRYEPLEPQARPPRAAPETDLDPSIKPAEVIVDPDVVRPEQPPGASEAHGGGVASPGPAQAVADGKPPLPSVVAPPVEAAQKKDVVRDDRFEISWETMLDPKYLAVWLSLLMVYPILRSERKKA